MFLRGPDCLGRAKMTFEEGEIAQKGRFFLWNTKGTKLFIVWGTNLVSSVKGVATKFCLG